MSGLEAYDNKWNRAVDTLISKSKYPDVLNDFKSTLLGEEGCQFTSIRIYLGIVNNFLDTINKDIKEINRMDYISFLGNMKTENHEITYRSNVYFGLKKFSSFLFKTYGIENYMEGISRPKGKPSRESIEKHGMNYILTEEELTHFWEYITTTFNHNYDYALLSKEEELDELRDIAMIGVFLATGWRISEIYKLDLDSYDSDTQMLYTRGKGQKEDKRYIPDMFAQYLAKYLFYRITKEGDGSLFANHKNNFTRLSTSTMGRRIEKHIHEAGINKKISPHKIRRSFATAIYNNNGHNMLELKNVMNHASMTTTEIYVTVDKDESKAKASQIIGNLYS